MTIIITMWQYYIPYELFTTRNLLDYMILLGAHWLNYHYCSRVSLLCTNQLHDFISNSSKVCVNISKQPIYLYAHIHSHTLSHSHSHSLHFGRTIPVRELPCLFIFNNTKTNASIRINIHIAIVEKSEQQLQ